MHNYFHIEVSAQWTNSCYRHWTKSGYRKFFYASNLTCETSTIATVFISFYYLWMQLLDISMNQSICVDNMNSSYFIHLLEYYRKSSQPNCFAGDNSMIL